MWVSWDLPRMNSKERLLDSREKKRNKENASLKGWIHNEITSN